MLNQPAAVKLDDDYPVDILGQGPGLAIYTQICSCFSVPDAFAHTTIISRLTAGLERLSASFPWVAGQVVNEGKSEGNSGVFKIKPLEKIPRLVVKDLRDDPSAPTMDTLRQASFPFRMLDESIIAPRHTLPTLNEITSNLKPIFLVQATFITGGLLLTFVSSHHTMDMPGQYEIMRLLSNACHNEPFTNEEIATGNLPRRNTIPLLDDSYEPGPELAHQIVKPIPFTTSDNSSTPPPPPPRCTWNYFTFPPSSLSALKSLATKTIPDPSSYVSTDDALTAFIWQSVTRARLPRLDPTAEVKLTRAVDARRYLGIPPAYPGLVQNMTYHTSTMQELVDESLGVIASQLRSAVDPKTSSIGHNLRALATFLARTPDKSIVNVTASIDAAVDTVLSSWAKVDCYGLDFNLGLGKPEAVRRPQFVPVESLTYLMPKSPDGEIAVGICLRDEDLERLKLDEEFAKYGRYVG